MNADNVKDVTSMHSEIGVDGPAFDPGTGDVVATCRDSGDGKTGATYVFHAGSPDKISLVATVKTSYGARTVARDPKSHHIFSIGTEQNDRPAPGAKNPRHRPGLRTFELLAIRKSSERKR